MIQNPNICRRVNLIETRPVVDKFVQEDRADKNHSFLGVAQPFTFYVIAFGGISHVSDSNAWLSSKFSENFVNQSFSDMAFVSLPDSKFIGLTKIETELVGTIQVEGILVVPFAGMNILNNEPIENKIRKWNLADMLSHQETPLIEPIQAISAKMFVPLEEISLQGIPLLILSPVNPTSSQSQSVWNYLLG